MTRSPPGDRRVSDGRRVESAGGKGDAAAETGRPVNIVAILTDELHHMSFAAMLRDGELGVHFRKDWGRIAFVSDHERLDSFVEEKSKPFHYDVRVFRLADEQAAIDWAKSGEGQTAP